MEQNVTHRSMDNPQGMGSSKCQFVMFKILTANNFMNGQEEFSWNILKSKVIQRLLSLTYLEQRYLYSLFTTSLSRTSKSLMPFLTLFLWLSSPQRNSLFLKIIFSTKRFNSSDNSSEVNGRLTDAKRTFFVSEMIKKRQIFEKSQWKKLSVLDRFMF